MDDTILDKLLCDIASGNDDAFSEFYFQMNKAVFSYALSLVHNRQLAEDISQDVFIKIKLGSQKYEPMNNPNGWILTITRNTALNALKKQKHEIPSDLLPQDTSAFTPDDIADIIFLKESMEKLSKTESQVITLYLVAGISQSSISKYLKLPTAAVNWKYRSGIKKLAAIMNEGV